MNGMDRKVSPNINSESLTRLERQKLTNRRMTDVESTSRMFSQIQRTEIFGKILRNRDFLLGSTATVCLHVIKA